MAILETIAIKTVWGKAADFLKGVPWGVWASLALLIGALVYGKVQYAQGKADERAAWEEEVQRIKDERNALAVVVEQQDREIAAAANQTIEERRKELDNAVANIPDQALTPRQRARVCAERVRQGRRCEVSSASASGT